MMLGVKHSEKNWVVHDANTELVLSPQGGKLWGEYLSVTIDESGNLAVAESTSKTLTMFNNQGKNVL